MLDKPDSQTQETPALPDLIPTTPGTAIAHTEANVTAALDFAARSKSAGTRRACQSDMRIFAAWCAARGLEPLPASPGSVTAFLAAEARRSTKASTITRRCAAITHAHKLAGHREPPTKAEADKAVMRGIRRALGTAPQQKQATTPQIVRGMIDACPTDTLAGLRDRALILVGFACVLRGSELVAIDIEHIEWTDDGARLTIPRSKTDQGQLPSVAPSGE